MIKVYECYGIMDENGYCRKNIALDVWNSPSNYKYPSKTFYFSDFKKHSSNPINEKHQVFQWLLECASKVPFPQQAKEIAEYALENYVTWEKKKAST